MSLLLDTHVWIWSREEPDHLGPLAIRRLKDPSEALYVATISTLEIAQLRHRGLLDLDGDVRDWVVASLQALRCGTIELSHDIAAGACALPEAFHKDPADRILVATAQARNLTLVTADDRILDSRVVTTLDARR